ncbi:MAG: nuclear transport factor 2 family protein [Solirubrobacterales bacterium]
MPSPADSPGDELLGLVRRIFDGWNADDVDAVLAVVDPEVVLDFRTTEAFPGLREEYRGHDGFREWWRRVREPFEYWNAEPRRLFRDGDKVVADVHFVAKGGSSGVPVEMDFGNFWTFRDGLMVRFEAYPSLDDALASAGMETERGDD